MAKDWKPHTVESSTGSLSLTGLTAREREVLRLLAFGRSNKEIARLLFITTHTVKAHVSRILHKLNAVSRTEAAVLWARHGLKGDE